MVRYIVSIPFKKGTCRWLFSDAPIDPRIVLVIPCERCKRLGTCRIVDGTFKEDAQSHHDLKPVTDAKYQPVFTSEAFDYIAKMRGELGCKNASCGNVVAVGEPAREAKHLKIISQNWAFRSAAGHGYKPLPRLPLERRMPFQHHNLFQEHAIREREVWPSEGTSLSM